MTIKLYQLPRAWGLPNISPASMKLETWLRLTGTPYELGPWPPDVAPPKGKWPYIQDGAVVMGDSTLIIEYLKRTRQIDPDKDLTPIERAISVAFRRMIKENLYWLLIESRWRSEEAWATYRPLLAAILPPDAIDGYRKGILEQMHGHGVGRHSSEEVHRIMSDDLMAISEFLGDKPFFFGDKPTGIDATVYGYVANVIEVPIGGPSAEFARQRKNLVAYCRRMRERFFSDLEGVAQTAS